ncbi:hypothetical protein ADL26_18120, partial [Thermoactinomyces vulgaris]
LGDARLEFGGAGVGGVDGLLGVGDLVDGLGQVGFEGLLVGFGRGRHREERHEGGEDHDGEDLLAAHGWRSTSGGSGRRPGVGGGRGLQVEVDHEGGVVGGAFAFAFVAVDVR